MISHLTDYVGLPVTASNQKTVDLLEEAAFQYAGMRGNPVETLNEALKLEKDECALGHCMVGIMMCIATCVPPESEQISGRLAKARDLIHAQGADALPREELYCKALENLSQGQWKSAAAALEAHLASAPHDLMAIRMLHDIYILTGDSKNIRDSIGRVLPSWSSGIPGYHFIMGMYAFGLEEMGEYRKAEDNALLAINMNRQDVWAHHALAHVFEMEGRANEGASWLKEVNEEWEEGNLLTSHMAWHHALFYLDQGNYNACLRIFGTYLEHADSAPGEVASFPLTDSASLLWRLSLCQALPEDNTAELWESVLRLFRPFIGQHLSAFNDIHIMMCLASLASEQFEKQAQYLEEAESFLASMEEYVSKYEAKEQQKTATDIEISEYSFPLSTPFPGQLYSKAPANVWVTKYLGLPACQALLAFTKGDFTTATQLLLSRRQHFQLLGSSHAQRDFLDWTLIESCLRGEQTKMASVLLAERTMQKGGNAQSWVRYATVLDDLGNATAAEQARMTAYQLGLGQAGKGAH
eukprot:CAMPEP_0117742682 /NCGR_PEP_ID=MMETSP0947-20121206/5683_1 /TAXON_ID=44440 /ORGANISM="Chattonella subsalsa, Strain CCMP2191" /LENGTH=525 /DNA_ID=CAMNT_0005559235 /DNA_START=81 /DNA_END=1658 /DNA_ORIENTATION=-